MPPLRKRLSAAWAALRGGPQATVFTGAASSRLTADWIFAATRSPDQEVSGDLETLRRRARDLARNNPHARRFRRLLSHNTVGPHGIRLQAKVKGQDGKPDAKNNRAIEAAWRRWCRKGACTADGQMSFAQVQRLYVETWAVDGEALLRLLPGFDNEFGFAVQLLDPDQLDHTLNRPAGSGTNEIRMGVEIDRWGRPVAYHVWDGHPSEARAKARKPMRIPAEQIVHDFTPDRPGQTRGVSWYAPVLFRARMLDGYEESVVVGARAGATTMGFFRPTEDYADAPDDPNEIPMEAEPGVFRQLPRGLEFTPYDPNQPATSFNEFDKAMLRSIATGLDVGYTSLTGDLSDVNYSSIRQGKLDERDAFRVVQTALMEGLLDRVHDQWLTWVLTTGALSLASRNRDRWRDHAWQPRGWDWVDPLKDIQASETAIAIGVTSRTRVCADRGIEFEEVLAELAEEERLAKEYGVELRTDPTPQSFKNIDPDAGDGPAKPPAKKPAKAAEWLETIEARMNGNGHLARNGNGRG